MWTALRRPSDPPPGRWTPESRPVKGIPQHQAPIRDNSSIPHAHDARTGTHCFVVRRSGGRMGLLRLMKQPASCTACISYRKKLESESHWKKYRTAKGRFKRAKCFPKKIQSSKYLEPVRRRSSKCFPTFGTKLGPKKIDW